MNLDAIRELEKLENSLKSVGANGNRCLMSPAKVSLESTTTSSSSSSSCSKKSQSDGAANNGTDNSILLSSSSGSTCDSNYSLSSSSKANELMKKSRSTTTTTTTAPETTTSPANKTECSPSTSSSSSSVVAALSVLSFSDSSSSLSSSVSYGDIATSLVKPANPSDPSSQLSSTSSSSSSCVSKPTSPNLTACKQIESILVNFNLTPLPSAQSTTNDDDHHHHRPHSHEVNSAQLSARLAPYSGKVYFGKEWLFKKLNDYLTNNSRQSVAKCLVLVGDIGTGKSHLTCELTWPTRVAAELDANSLIIGSYFFNFFNVKQNTLRNFYTFMCKLVKDFYAANVNSFKTISKLGVTNVIPLFRKETKQLRLDDFLNDESTNLQQHYVTDEDVEKYTNKFINNILKPLNNLELNDSIKQRRFYVILDGLDDLILQSERLMLNDDASTSRMLTFLNRTFLFFPSWLNLIVTCKRATEKIHFRKYLTNIKYDKIIIDRCVLNKLGTNVQSAQQTGAGAKREDESGPAVDTSHANILSSLSSHSLVQKCQPTTQAAAQQHQQQQNRFKRLSTPMGLVAGIDLFNSTQIANLKDVQTYILKRLDLDHTLKTKFSKLNKQCSIELLNLLLIKSNYSLLYVEKIFDFILGDFLNAADIKYVPVHLNGLYLYLIEKIIVNLERRPDEQSPDSSSNQPSVKDLLYNIIGVGLLEMRPFARDSLYEKIKFRYGSLKRAYFDAVFDYVESLLFSKSGPNNHQLFHSSFVDWFTDIKFSTRKYYFNLSECNLHLAYYYYDQLVRIKSPGAADAQTSKHTRAAVNAHWCRFKFHLSRAKLASGDSLTDAGLDYVYSLCEYDYQYKVCLNTLDRKLLQCKKILKIESNKKLFNADTNSNEISVCSSSLSSSLSSSSSSVSLRKKMEENERLIKNLNNFKPADVVVTKNDAELANTKRTSNYESSIYDLFQLNRFSTSLNDDEVSGYDNNNENKTSGGGAKYFKSVIFDLVAKADVNSIKLLLANDRKLINLTRSLTDAFNQTVLLVAVKLNNYELVEYFLQLNAVSLDHCDNSGWTALRYSAWMGNENVVRILLENGAQIDACDAEGRTALRAAVFSGHDHIVRLLIKYGANVNKCDLESRSVLHVAVYMGHLSIINYLILNGAYVNQRDMLGRGTLATSIYTSSARNQYEIVKLLIKYGAKLDQADNNNQTALILAAMENQIYIVDLLIKSGADVDYFDNEGYTALTHAIKKQYNELVEYLLKNNAATHILDKDGRSVLSIASSLGAEKIVRLLMDRSLDEMHRDNIGWTPLHETVNANHLNIATMLLNYGSEIDACDNEGKTSLFYACQRGHLEMVKMLVGRQADVNIRSHEGSTPFRVSCLENRLDICQHLLEKGVHIDSKDPDGRTTLCHLITLNKEIETIKFLLDHGASVNEKDNDGRTCLHAAVLLPSGGEKILSLLLKYNAHVDELDNRRASTLIAAVVGDKLDAVKMLIAAGANLNQQDREGSTALSIAVHNGNYQIVEELLKNGAHIFASARNPIKMAHQVGNDPMVKLLQYWSTLCYQQQQQHQLQPQVPSVPRNSKSVESFRSKSARQSNLLNDIMTSSQRVHMPNFNNRCAITPTTFSNYMRNLNHISTSFSASPLNYESKFELFQNRSSQNKSLIINVGNGDNHHHQDVAGNRKSYCNGSDLNINNQDPSTGTSTKMSKLKYVRDKLLRKSSLLNSTDRNLNLVERRTNSTILTSSSIRELNNLKSPDTPGSRSVRQFSPSMNEKPNMNNKLLSRKSAFFMNSTQQVLNEDEISDFTFCDKENYIMNESSSRTDSIKSSSERKNSSKGSIKNSTFVQMIKKRFRFFTNGQNQSGTDADYAADNSEKTNSIDFKANVYKQMHRSKTDTINSASAGLNSTADTSINTLTDSSAVNFKHGRHDDDVAHIFNRNSLNDCLNPRRSSFREHNLANGPSSFLSSLTKPTSNNHNSANPQLKRPTCLQLNHFKKETSI